MGFDELKQKQSVMWGTGPYERLPEHYTPALDHLARALDARPGERVLDVATGTGALATRLARTGAEVVGLDLAPALIETAGRLAGEDGVDIRYEVGDAENMPYEDASFDVVGSSFGAIFAPDHAAVAQELARVCRPGGRLGMSCWSHERGVVEIFAVMKRFQPLPPPGVGSAFAWGDTAHAAELLREAFELRYEEGDAPQTGDSGEEVWELFSTVYGPTRTLAESLDAERREEFHRAFVELYEGFRTNGGVHHSRPYVLVLGTRR